jgi:20S proteasome alpha/beta subunit
MRSIKDCQMSKDQALRLALEALENHIEDPRCDNLIEKLITAIKAALEAEDEPVGVSPLQFVEMVMEKEDCVGKPIIWAEWPNKENT